MSSAFPATDPTASAGRFQGGPQQQADISFGTILRRAVLAGLLAGAVAAVFVGLVAEDSIDAAIAIEEAGAGTPITTRASPRTRAMLPTATVTTRRCSPAASRSWGDWRPRWSSVWSLAWCSARSTPPSATRSLSAARRDGFLLLAAAAYLATAVLPSLKYPANPPAVGDPDTVNERTLLYFTFLAASIILAVAVGMLYKRLAARLERSAAVVSTAAAALAGTAVLLAVWPSSPDRVAEDFPAQLLWDFRLESLATLTIIWSTFGLGMGWMSRPRT